MDARGKFGEHERSVRVARGAAVVYRGDVEFCVKNHEKSRKILWVRVKGSFTLQKNLGPDRPKKWYGPITFVKKYWSFHRAIGAPCHFFLTGPDPIFSVV